MTIKEIDIQELRTMRGKEGLILQGCGGELTEWVEGINKLLTEKEMLLEGSRFENCYSFKRDGITCLLFPFEDQKMNTGKLAIWRLISHQEMGSMWLSDFVDIYLDGFLKSEETVKPDCPLIGADGNIFNLIGIARKTLKEHDMLEESQEMTDRVYSAGNYEEALNIIGEYVNITSVDDEIEEGEEGVMIQQ